MTVRVWLGAAAVGTFLTGCGLEQKAAADPVDAEMNHEFAVPGGEVATIQSENLRLQFTRVLEDSRCPTQVECFWTGQARITVEVAPAESGPTTVEFNTNPAPGQNIQTAQVAQYTIELLSLEPYPQTPEQSIPLEEYRATLLVRADAP